MNFTPLYSSSKGNAYLVKSHGVGALLLEAGIPIKKIREELWSRGIRISSLVGCLCSHAHMDHAKAVKDLLKSGVDCYMHWQTADALGVKDHHRTHSLEPLKTYQVEGWRVMTFDLEHDVPALGFFIEHRGERCLFIPDTGFVKNRFQGVTILAIECNNIEELLSKNILNGSLPAVAGRRIRRSHLSLERVIAMLRSNDLRTCRQIWLLHLSDGNSDEKKMIQTVQEATGIATYAANQ